MREIIQAVEYLNKVLPADVIALPFYSALHENYKNIVTKIDTKINSIKNRKQNIHTEWGEEYVEDMTVISGIYKRAVIIATNVAEASITLNSLKYVVDNGYSKVNKFKPNLGIMKLEEEEISEASRIQRKGRVGRVSNGIVYYMYPKNAKKNIKPNYKITQEDLASSLLKLLCIKNINETNIHDINNYDRLIVSNIISPNLLSFTKIADQKLDNAFYTVKSGLLKIYLQNYRINNMPLDLRYYNSMPNGVYNEYYVLDSGQSMMNLLDRYGRFYLINPFENF